MRDYLILKLDGKYFGYGNDPIHPEALFSSPRDAYVFDRREHIKDLLIWYPHNKAQIIDLLVLAHREHNKEE